MTEHRGRQRSRTDRVPPHNLDAEAAALGAALLHPQAADAIVGAVTADDFYKPANGHIAAAILSLHAADVMVDAVTVAEELRQAGILADVGGMEYLAELQNSVPAISNARRYARTVRNSAILRRIIATATDIAELGYTRDDPADALARANDLVAALGAPDIGSTSTLEIADMAETLTSDLEPEEAVLLRRSDGAALLYAGKMHTFQAEPSAGKSWIALWAAAEVLAAGGTAVYIDQEDIARTCVGRLLRLGVTAAAIISRFRHVAPQGPLGAAEHSALWQLLDEMNPDLVIIDGVANALSREGLDEDSASDYVRWVNLLPRPIARTGATVLMLDHVSKDPEQRGRWARGTGAKLGEIDGAAYQVKVRSSFSRHRAGYVDLIIAKDRPGGVGAIGETAARVHVDPHADGEHVGIRVETHQPEQQPGDDWKPTVLMGKLWAALNEASAPLTATALSALIHSEKPKLVRQAIARLIAEGYVAEVKSGRATHLVCSKPYGAAAPAWRQPPPPDPDLFDAAEADTSWVDDRYLEQLEQHANTPTPFYDREDF